MTPQWWVTAGDSHGEPKCHCCQQDLTEMEDYVSLYTSAFGKADAWKGRKSGTAAEGNSDRGSTRAQTKVREQSSSHNWLLRLHLPLLRPYSAPTRDFTEQLWSKAETGQNAVHTYTFDIVGQSERRHPTPAEKQGRDSPEKPKGRRG